MFPSLLYLPNKQPGKMIPPHVCDDLQLTQLLRRDAITVSSAACGRDDILARHEVFRSLDDPEVRSHFSALHKNVTTLNRLDGLLSSSKCSRERDVVFLTLMHEYVQFSLQAAKTMGSGVFLKRMRHPALRVA